MESCVIKANYIYLYSRNSIADSLQNNVEKLGKKLFIWKIEILFKNKFPRWISQYDFLLIHFITVIKGI